MNFAKFLRTPPVTASDYPNTLISKFTCYKNPMNRTCIDLNLTNSPKYFENSNVSETRLSNFHKMTVTTESIKIFLTLVLGIHFLKVEVMKIEKERQNNETFAYHY